MLPTRLRWMPFVLAFILSGALAARAAEMPEQDPWKALPGYEYGQDMAPLLAIDRAVIQSMASADARAATATKLAEVLENPAATLAARQYACLQLRQVGTPAQVPLLARLLQESDVAEPARYAIESIPGEEASAALRDALSAVKGKRLVGVIQSLADRRDTASVPTLIDLARSKEAPVADAALAALGRIADGKATAFLIARAKEAGVPTPPALASPLLECASVLANRGDTERAKATYSLAAQPGQALGVRRAGLDGLLGLDGKKTPETIAAWLVDADPQRQLIAAGHLDELSDAQLDALQSRLGTLPESAAMALLQVLAARKGSDVLPLVLAAAQSDRPELRLAGIRGLALVGDATATAVLIDALASGGDVAESAATTLARLPKSEVAPALLDALKSRPEIRVSVIDILARLKVYEAIDPLIEIAAQKDPAVYDPALDGLRQIADPDKTDTPRLVRLLLRVDRGRHRDEVEKTILIVCEKQPPGSDPAGPVLDALAQTDATETAKVLPLLGRLGGPKALAAIEKALDSTEPTVREAAVRGLCNWPDATVAPQLLQVANESDQPNYRRWALRAYVRVVTLPNGRPAADTLAMLQSAMKLATVPEDKQLVIQRAATVRTMECVHWLASYLDDPALAQVACGSIVELAHQRFLRHPNMDTFGPLLDKVAKTATDAEIVERAKRYRLGL